MSFFSRHSGKEMSPISKKETPATKNPMEADKELLIIYERFVRPKQFADVAGFTGNGLI